MYWWDSRDWNRRVSLVAPPWRCDGAWRRKVRLWATSCVSQVEHLIPLRLKAYLRAGERLAELEVSDSPEHLRDMHEVRQLLPEISGVGGDLGYCLHCLVARRGATATLARVGRYLKGYGQEEACQGLMQCCLGPRQRVRDLVLAWQNGLVQKLAKEVRDNQDWGLMPVLADALLHLRTGLHCLGCNVLDWILGDWRVREVQWDVVLGR